MAIWLSVSRQLRSPVLPRFQKQPIRIRLRSSFLVRDCARAGGAGDCSHAPWGQEHSLLRGPRCRRGSCRCEGIRVRTRRRTQDDTPGGTTIRLTACPSYERVRFYFSGQEPRTTDKKHQRHLGVGALAAADASSRRWCSSTTITDVTGPVRRCDRPGEWPVLSWTVRVASGRMLRAGEEGAPRVSMKRRRALDSSVSDAPPPRPRSGLKTKISDSRSYGTPAAYSQRMQSRYSSPCVAPEPCRSPPPRH